MNKTNYISVDELKAWNPNMDFSKHSTIVLSGMITRASDYIDEYINYSLKVEVITNETCQAKASTDGDLIIFTKKIPIVSVSKIELKLGTSISELGLIDGNGDAKYDIPDSKRHIRYPYSEIELSGNISISNFFSVRNRFSYARISYMAGYYTIPSGIKEATGLIVLSNMRRPATSQNLRSMSQGAISMSYNTRESTMLKEAKEILNKYRKNTY